MQGALHMFASHNYTGMQKIKMHSWNTTILLWLNIMRYSSLFQYILSIYHDPTLVENSEFFDILI